MVRSGRRLFFRRDRTARLPTRYHAIRTGRVQIARVRAASAPGSRPCRLLLGTRSRHRRTIGRVLSKARQRSGDHRPRNRRDFAAQVSQVRPCLRPRAWRPRRPTIAASLSRRSWRGKPHALKQPTRYTPAEPPTPGIARAMCVHCACASNFSGVEMSGSGAPARTHTAMNVSATSRANRAHGTEFSHLFDRRHRQDHHVRALAGCNLCLQ